MSARFSLPNDDLISRLLPTITISNPDTAYPGSNWLINELTGVTPENPVKWTTTSGYADFDFGIAVNVSAFAALFTNWSDGLIVTLKGNSGPSFGTPPVSQTITVPAVPADGWSISPWTELAGAPTYRYWRLEMGLSGPANASPLALGRPCFSGNLQSIPRDFRHPESGSFASNEQHELLPPNKTATGIDMPIPLIERIRDMTNVVIQNDDVEVATLIEIRRATRGRMIPFLMIPDDGENDAWWVRLIDVKGSRQFITTNWNAYPFAFQEVSRGLPWPGPV